MAMKIVCDYLTPSRIRDYHKNHKKFFDDFVGDLTDSATGLLVDPLTYQLIDPPSDLDPALHTPNPANVKRINHPEKWATTGIWLLQGTAAHAAAQYGRMRMMEGQQFTMEEILDAALAGYYHAITETFPEPTYPETTAYLQDLLARRGAPDPGARRPGLLAAWEYLETANTNIKKDPFVAVRKPKHNTSAITFGSDSVQSLHDAEKSISVMVSSIVNRLLPTEVLTLKANGEVKRDLRITSVERKVNYTGFLGFRFFGRTDTKAADGTIKDLKTSHGEIDFWMIFQLLCYGLPDYLSNAQNPRLDPIQIDQLVKDDAMSINVFPYSPTAADYAACHQLILATCDQIQLMQVMASYDEDEFQSLLADYRQALYVPLEADYDPDITVSHTDGFGPLLQGQEGIALKVKRGFSSLMPRLSRTAALELLTPVPPLQAQAPLSLAELSPAAEAEVVEEDNDFELV